jgi:site-specific DNA-cytosine methylase
MSDFTWGSIVPLIGGETIAMERTFGTRPEYILSYSPFVANDLHLLNYYDNEVPYHLIDKEEGFTPKRVDVVNAVCPCAGLSSLSPTSSADSKTNDWMFDSAKYVFENVKPKVLWGENAPQFATNKGTKIREKLRDLAFENDYSMSVIKTKSLVHGLPQIRVRSFYFFWQGMDAPLFDYYSRPHVRFEDLLRGVTSNTQREPIGQGKPSDNKYLKFILESVRKQTFQEFYDSLEKSVGVIDVIERESDWTTCAEWMEANGYDREAKSSRRRQAKLDDHKGYMKKDLVIAKDYIGAFVGHMPSSIKHPDYDRYIDYREAMTIMGLPQDFILGDPKKSTNHICQNVPVQTATDMATEVREALLGNRKSSGHRYVVQDNIHQKVEETLYPTRTLVDFAV